MSKKQKGGLIKLMMSGSRCVKRYHKIILGLLIKSASFLLKMKKIFWCWKFIVAKRGKEDVLMTELWTPLICVC